jgi:sphinganine-1-phosphate aldolase
MHFLKPENREHNIGLHVDCCLGSFLVPFTKEHGVDLPQLDFSIQGITSISIDPSKYGNTANGLSVVLYKSDKLRAYQFYTNVSWRGGLYASRTFCGSRSAASIYSTWVSLVYQGRNKFKEIAKSIFDGVAALKKGINGIKELEILGEPKLCSVAFCCKKDKKKAENVKDMKLQRGSSRKRMAMQEIVWPRCLPHSNYTRKLSKN